MAEYAFLSIELALFVAYPLKRTYFIWKNEEIDTVAYREAVVYWAFFAMLQALSWNFDKIVFGAIRIGLILLVMIKVSWISSLLFRASSLKKKTN